MVKNNTPKSNKKKNSSTSGKKKENSKKKQNVNKETLDALTRLSSALTELNEKSNSCSSQNAQINTIQHVLPIIRMGHWRTLPQQVEEAYRMMREGAEMVKASSTKYTLLGKIDLDDGSMVSEEIRKGCELLSTGALLLFDPRSQCARSARIFCKRSVRAIVASCVNLIKSFVDNTNNDSNISTQMTGAVWSTCDDLITGKTMPRGNAPSVKRECFTWIRDCNDTMEEFEELVQNSIEIKNEDDRDEEYYATGDLGIIKASIALLKCSRGIMSASLKACEFAGEFHNKNVQLRVSGQDTCPMHGELVADPDILQYHSLEWISTLHEMARTIGEGVTDLGITMYPPININLGENDDNNDGIVGQIMLQKNRILEVANYILKGIVFSDNDNAVDDLDTDKVSKQKILHMTKEIVDLTKNIQTATSKRFQEAKIAVDKCRSLR
eukprot:CAMPEP_0184865050 /NCGR_PEP_ID=MMETSP0580-20130426/16796_1 /TAXON_ID=1118495 /ORGANISM="Dactyliosolen fragilissimus" /LENGTH=439 /DNA_ID=CAMNT_0027364065 /DNA_START=153 /DNA_END=1472 /DNA_ORIENTATION=-